MSILMHIGYDQKMGSVRQIMFL